MFASDVFLPLVRELSQRLLEVFLRTIGFGRVCQHEHDAVKLYKANPRTVDDVFVEFFANITSPSTRNRGMENFVRKGHRFTKMQNDRNKRGL